MTSVFPAPAKVNLTLEVLARRADGFHGVRSVMIPLELADELSVEPSDRFYFECDRADLAGDDNLAVRALRLLGDRPPHARVHLRKHIPTQAGLGGGSSDAAAILRAAIAGTFGPPPPLDWVASARALGSDVPFFLSGTGALVEGTGERVTPLGTLPRWHALVVKPPVAVSTATAYATLDAIDRPTRPRSGSVSLEMVDAIQRADFAAVQQLLQNDFHEPIVAQAPEIALTAQALRTAGAANALLAGSGSCVFTIAPNAAKIERVLGDLQLPETYLRFATAFASTPDWRG